MIAIPQAFSASYAEARVKFLEGAATAGLAIESHLHPLPGRDGEVLAMDVARSGPANAANLLIVSSACHGVEGFCGSGVQVFATHDAEWLELARSKGVAVLYVHALNPYGFSHIRRVTHENVDLNRNFQDFSKPLPVNGPYAELAELFLPRDWPPGPENQAAIQNYIQTRGMPAYQAAMTARLGADFITAFPGKIAALATSDPAFIHLKAFDLPKQPEKLVITTAGIVQLGELLARSYLERQ